MRMIHAVALATAATLGGGAASAQAIDASSPEAMLEAVRAFGHKARLETDDAGAPMIAARVDDINYAIYFYGCEDEGGCHDVQFAASFDLDPGLSPDFANQWNEDWVFGRLSVDESGDPLFTYFLITDGGLSPETFDSVLAVWSNELANVITDIGY